MASISVAGASAVAQFEAPAAILALPLGLPNDLDQAAVILQAEDRREVTPELVALTGSPDPAVRGRAALAMGRIGLPASYPRLLAMLRDGRPEVRAIAAFAVGLLEIDLEPATIVATRSRISERLLSAVNDPDPGVVAQALWSLGALADPGALATVAAVLADGSLPPNVIEAAIDAWWRLPGATAAPLSRHVQSDDPALRLAAVIALDELDSPNALPALSAALSDPLPEVRAAAIRGVHAAPAAVMSQYLIPALRDTDWRVATAALNWVMALWRRDVEVDDDAFTAVLIASTRRDRYVQGLAFQALASAPGKFSVPEDRILQALSNGDATSRFAALVAMGVDDSTLNADLDAVLDAYAMSAPPLEGSAADIPEGLLNAPLEAAALMRVLVGSDESVAQAWFQVLANHGPDAARAEALRLLRVQDPEQASALALALLQQGSPVLQTVAAEVVRDLLATGAMVGEARSFAWGDTLWTVQRELGEVGALDARLTVLAALLSVDSALMRSRALALVLDDDRAVRLWAFRNITPAPGTQAAARMSEAARPLETGLDIADYRALAARVISVQQAPPRVRVETGRGTFVWEMRASWAPLTTIAYLEWLEGGLFDEITAHRVAPGLFIQTGDPTATGYGSAAGSLRSEETPVPYATSVVGLALSLWPPGRDTGGSQFVVVQSPQPYLTGRYPIFGVVVENPHVVPRIQPGDWLRMTLQ